MAETHEPEVIESTPAPQKRIRFRWTDALVFAIIITVIVILIVVLMNRLTLKRDVAHAQIVSDKVVTAIEQRNGADARALGDAQFKAKNTDAGLTMLFKQREIATLNKPSLERTIAYTDKNGRTIYFVYKYSALKVPFYIRVGVHNTDGKWQLINLSGNADPNQLGIK